MYKLGDKVSVLRYSVLTASIVLVLLAGALGFYAYSQDPYLVEEVMVTRASAVSRYNITFNLEQNDIFGTRLSYNGSLPIYLSLLQGAEIWHSFSISQGSATGSRTLSIYLAHPDGWAKTLLKISDTFSEKSSITLPIQLNISETLLLMESLVKQIGGRLTEYDIIISTVVEYTATIESETRSGSINHTVALNIDVARNRVAVKGNPREYEPHIVTVRRELPVTLFGLSIEGLRVATPILGIAGVALLSTYIVAFVRARESNSIAKLESRYRDIIVEGSKLPESPAGGVVALKSLEELVKVARILERPIVKVVFNSNTVYYIVDRGTTYVVEV